MAKTLLDAVNEILKRVGMIQGDDNLLTSLSVSARQRSIDIAIQVTNEGIDELYSTTDEPQARGQGESTITLISSTRTYSLATDLVRLRWPFVDETNNQYLYESPGGYNDMLLLDPEQDDTGLPMFAAIRPTDGLLYLDRIPTSAEDSRIYTYQYDKDLSLSTLTDTVPFSDAVFRAMVPAWVQLWKREQNNEFDGDLFKANIGRAARLMTQAQPRTDYCPR
jgi:hypothetical protein